MGTDCHVVVVAAAPACNDLLTLAADRVELLEDCWSRFRPASALNQLNARAGQGPVPVSADLLVLVTRMKQAWSMSNGLFDPTVLSSMTALGYDADFDTVTARPAASVLDDVLVAAAPGMSGVVVDDVASTVALPAGVGIDPGAIGKGLASDIVATELYDAGADGVLVNLGGDLAFIGTTADGTGWAIGVEDERKPVDDPDRVIRRFDFPDGATTAGVATSTTLKRRWAQGRRHHVIDPRTGSMSVSDLVQVTVVSDEAWNAEVLATTALLMTSDEAERWLRDRDITAILLTTDRAVVTTDEEGRHG
jgi:thiamine biosynthesis lipoprotein